MLVILCHKIGIERKCCVGLKVTFVNMAVLKLQCLSGCIDQQRNVHRGMQCVKYKRHMIEIKYRGYY